MLQTSAALWLPFTQMEGFDSSSRTFVRGEGAFLYDAGGARIFDAVSSIWTTVHGHCHPAIARAVARQAETLDHATLLGASNPLAEELAGRLARMLSLDYAFFASDGASAVEASLKMALQYWQNNGQPQRNRFIRLTGAYHGDTAGAMSVSDIGVFKSRFDAVTFESLAYGGGRAQLERTDVAAVICEPLVQAAAGMRLVHPDAYAPLAGMEPLLIADEIATGFGRTGTMFAHQQTGLRPDIVCLGKGITGGALALSATLVSGKIYDAFLGAHAEHKQFFHGHSYAGNPIACAAALANLDIFEAEQTLAHVQSLVKSIAQDLARLACHPLVRGVRASGLMIGIELDGASIEVPDAVTPGWHVANRLYGLGYFTRPIGDVIQLVPPLCSTVAELRGFVAALESALA